jgi:hypothetical protein
MFTHRTRTLTALILLGLTAAPTLGTILTFETMPQSNVGMENLRTVDTNLSIGSRVDQAVRTYLNIDLVPFDLTYDEGNGWTPNIVVTWPWGDNGGWGSDSEYDTYVDWNGRGSVTQAEIIYDADNQLDLEFTPDAGYGVLINSFDLDEWEGGGQIVIQWQVLDASGVLASGTVPLIDGGRVSLETGLTAADVTIGETVILRLSNVDLTGDYRFVALDNLNFDQVQDAPGCAGDLDGDGDVDQSDLGVLLGAWGDSDEGDLDGDGDTDQADLGTLLSDWGCGV